MPFFDYLRNFFGFRSINESPQNRFEDDQQYRDSFRNPIWQNDDDEEDVSNYSNRQPTSRYHFKIFTDPFEMTRFFENQMDDLMRNFFGGFNGFGNDRNIFGPFGNDFSNALPMPENFDKKLPRDEVLKPNKDSDSTFFFEDFFNKKPSGKNLREELLKPSYEMPYSNSEKLDSDIDGKINTNELAKIWQTPSKSQNSIQRSFGSSVSTQIVRRPDGSIEERRTVKDTDGNEEVTVTRKIGDKVHTIISKKVKDGTEVKTEDIVNMDENELRGFDEKWSKIDFTPTRDRADNFPWHKLFGPYPKL